MTNALQLYLRYVGVSIRSQMQYRVSFLLLSLSQLAATGIEFLSIWALFDRFGELRGWTLPEVALFYGLIHVAFSIADAGSRGFDMFGNMVKMGDFDRLLLRPRSTALQLAGQELTLRRVGRFTQGALVLLYAATALDLRWSPDKVALLLAAIIGGVCLFAGIIVLQATLAFWTTETLEIFNTISYGGVETAQYPLTIYRSWFRAFFTLIIPLAAVNYFPTIALLGRADPLGTPRWFQWLSPTIGVLFLLVALQIWKIGERHYRSTGS